jgi:photosystem II stability/assembly factor-like uncharacterized protein
MRVSVRFSLVLMMLFLCERPLLRVDAAPPPDLFRFEEIKMLTQYEGWATGSIHQNTDGKFIDEGYILYTHNSGLRWEDVTPPEGISLDPLRGSREINAFFLDQSTAWVVSDKVWMTRDGGQTWRSAPFADVDMHDHFFKMTFADRNHGWILLLDCCNEEEFTTLYHTTDGGQTWTPISDAGDPPDNLGGLITDGSTGMVFTDGLSGWMTLAFRMDTGGVARTVDGGISWTGWFIDTLPAPDDGTTLNECATTRPVLLPNRFSVLVVCWKTDAIFLYSTSDEGQNWRVQTLVSVDDNLKDIHYEVSPGDADTLWLAIWTTDENGTNHMRLYQSLHEGQDLIKVVENDLNFTPAIFALDFLDETRGWWADKNTNNLYRTADGGQTWVALNPEVRFQEK